MHNDDVRPSNGQLATVRALQKRLGIDDAELESACKNDFGGPLGEMDRSDVAELIQCMSRWKRSPIGHAPALTQQGMFR